MNTPRLEQQLRPTWVLTNDNFASASFRRAKFAQLVDVLRQYQLRFLRYADQNTRNEFGFWERPIDEEPGARLA